MSRGASWVLLNGGPGWLAAVAAVAVLAVVASLRGSRGLSAPRRAFLLGVRLLAVAAAAAAVVRPAREVDLVRARKVPLVLLVDDSRSMGLGPSPVAPKAVRWLKEARGEQETLAELYRVSVLGLGAPPKEIDPDAVGRAGGFAARETPLGRTLESLARARPDTAAVVLLSDGRDTQTPGRPPEGLPFSVFPVLFDPGPLPDVWIEAVETPPVGFIRTPVEVRVRLGLSDLPPGEGQVTLLEEGAPLQTASVALGASGGEVALTFTPQRTGRRAYRVEVTPRPGEVTVENNRAQFSLNVVRDKTRVLLVAGTPTWDVKFLRRRLRQDPGVDLITFMILRTPQDLTAVPQDELSLIPFPTRELFSEELPSFDAVIFANFDYAPYVPRRYLDNLVRFVREDGGGFAMLGGDRSFALGRYEGTPLEAILPVELSGAAPGRAYLSKSFRPRLTAAGRAHPLFQWMPRAEENRLLWNRLPALEGMNWVLRPKAGAVVLAENPEARNEFGPLPLIALGEYGAGRTLAVATDSLWHWALPHVGAGGDDAVYRSFWTRALRWLVHDPEMELVRLAVPPMPTRQGQEVRLRARVFDRSYRPARGALLSGRLVGEGGAETGLVWEESAPGEYVTAPVELPGPGLWRVEVEGTLDGVFLGRDAVAFPVEGPSAEGLRLGVDEDYLRALAAGSGGEVFPDGDNRWLDRLLDRGRDRMEVVGRRVEEPWPTAPLLLLAVALFGLDWGLRRLFGY
ncbi:MAG: hypothetical protein Kow0092_14970 [Deferrisomatales bacterium]